MITTVAVAGYRSLRDVVVPLHHLDVVTGANGSGKSSLYRALRLLADCGSGRVVASLAREGGLPSALWAGPETLGGARKGGYAVEGTRRQGPVSLRLGFAADDGFGYLVDLGLPIPADTSFGLDPEVKREMVFSGPVARPNAVLVERHGPLVRVREGREWVELTRGLAPWESMLTELADPRRAPELLAVSDQIQAWRFYDGFRVDADAPARRTQVGTRTPVLDHDGADLAAALQTIREIGDAAALDRAVSDAFDGASIDVTVAAGRFDLALRQPGMLRPLASAELSDGTLRYLLLVAALLTPRPPALMVLNEPETSLHPDLLPPLARLVQRAAPETQLVVVSHSRTLLDALAAGLGVELVEDLGETTVAGQEPLDAPSWHWGSR
ncbi:MAG: AAA family ATPase [Lapillicoccus sp.]